MENNSGSKLEMRIEQVMIKTGWDYDHARAQIRATKKRWGIKSATYVSENLWMYPIEIQGPVFERIKELRLEKKNIITNAVATAAGIPLADAEQQMVDAKKKWSVSYSDFLKHKLYEMPESEREAEYNRISEERKERAQGIRNRYIERVMRITGRGYDETLANMTDAYERNGVSFQHYYRFKYWNLSEELRNTLFSKGHVKLLKQIYNANFSMLDILRNKTLFNEECADYIGRIWCNSDELTFDEFTEKFSGTKKFIYKPKGSSGGKGIITFELGENVSLKDVYEEVTAMPPGVVENYLIQHADMQKLSLKSVNTIRIVTIRTNCDLFGIEPGKTHFVYAGVRMGTGTNIVDNMHSGGLIASVDIDTGKILTDAFSFELERFEKHPDTRSKIRGHKIPYFAEAKKLITKLCEDKNVEGYIGWDVAITENGPVIIEANTDPGAASLQLPYLTEGKGMRYVIEKYIPSLREAALEENSPATKKSGAEGEKERVINALCEKYGCDYDMAEKRVNYAVIKTGITYQEYLDCDAFILNEGRAINHCKRVVKKRKGALKRLEEVGISEKKANEIIEKIRKSTGRTFTYFELAEYALYEKDDEEIAQLIKNLELRRKLFRRLKKSRNAPEVFETIKDELHDVTRKTIQPSQRQTIAETFLHSHPDMDPDLLEERVIDAFIMQKTLGFSPMEYENYHIYDEPFERRVEYLSNSKKNNLVRSLPKGEDGEKFRQTCALFDNKYKTYERLQEYYKRDLLEVTSRGDLKQFKKFCKNNQKFIKKPETLSQGKGIEILEVDVDGSPDELFKIVRKHKRSVVESLIVQSEIMSRFNESTVNTLRVITFHNGVEPQILGGFFRTGRKGSVVDNAGSGGVFAALDPATGTICSDGADEGGREYKCHPDSGIEYKGFEIPKWDELKALVLKLTAEFPEMPIIGWDFAFTSDEEWVVLEVNCMPEFVQQGPTRKGLRKEFTALIQERKENLYK